MKMNTIYFKDCMDVMKKYPDKHFDLMLSDPPYNIDAGIVPNNSGKESRRAKMVKTYNDNMKKEEYYKWCDEWFEEVMRVSKRAMFTCGRWNIHYWTGKDEYIGMAIWYIPNSSSRGKHTTFIRWEPILCFGKWGHDRLHGDVFKVVTMNGFLNKGNEWIHPHPKPEKLYRDILSMVDVKTVLDPFVGSGTVIQICIEKNIEFVGCEMNEKYKPDIMKRMMIGEENSKSYDLFEV